MFALAQHLGPTLSRAALVQLWTPCISSVFLQKTLQTLRFKTCWDKISWKLGVWRRHGGLKDWKPAVPFVSSCSASSCTRCRGSQSWTARGKCLNREATTRINCFKMCQNVSRVSSNSWLLIGSENALHEHRRNEPNVSQEASTLPAGHVPGTNVGHNHSRPTPLWAFQVLNFWLRADSPLDLTKQEHAWREPANLS